MADYYDYLTASLPEPSGVATGLPAPIVESVEMPAKPEVAAEFPIGE